MEKTLIELDSELWVPFKYRTEDLGTAEFLVCVKWYGWGDFEFWVDPVQTHITEWWHSPRHEYPDFSITSYGKLSDPRTWLCNYCREHETSQLRIYTPDNAKYLRLSHDGISFHKEKWGG